MASRLRRWLYLIHRWLGVGLCLFLFMWFFSGVVMMYVGYPKLTEQERLQHLPALTATDGLLSPADALDRAGASGALRELTLSRARAGAPVYQAVLAGGERLVVDAESGQLAEAVTRDVVMASARVFAGDKVDMRYGGTLDEDAFTHSRSLDRHRPLHRVDLANPEATRLYVSGTTGEVVRDATRQERGWNYVGAWIHWLYPFRGNVFDGQWANIVNVLTIIGLVLTVAGTVVGVWRWRFATPYRNGKRTPYPERAMRWHHVSGLLFAAITLTWLFSGLMSMGPWGFLRSPVLPLQTEAMQGPPLTVAALTMPPRALTDGRAHVRELQWVRRLGREGVAVHDGSGRIELVDARQGQAITFEREQIVEAAARLLQAPLARVDILQRYDLYYYDRAPHTMTGGRERPLPIIRAVFDDAQATWVHVDATTAQVLGRTDSNGRLRRWLFQMLHSWDWLPLLNQRPLWDIVLIALSVGGGLLSATGILIGWRRIGRKLKVRTNVR